jgi:hypothetical protein
LAVDAPPRSPKMRKHVTKPIDIFIANSLWKRVKRKEQRGRRGTSSINSTTQSKS